MDLMAVGCKSFDNIGRYVTVSANDEVVHDGKQTLLLLNRSFHPQGNSL